MIHTIMIRLPWRRRARYGIRVRARARAGFRPVRRCISVHRQKDGSRGWCWIGVVLVESGGTEIFVVKLMGEDACRERSKTMDEADLG